MDTILIYKEAKRGILRQFPYGDCVQQFASLCVELKGAYYEE